MGGKILAVAICKPIVLGGRAEQGKKKERGKERISTYLRPNSQGKGGEACVWKKREKNPPSKRTRGLKNHKIGKKLAICKKKKKKKKKKNRTK